MRFAIVALAWLLVAPLAEAQQVTIIRDVRALIAKDDFATAEKTLRTFIADNGPTPDALEALSWLGRGNLAKDRLDEANRFATETYGLALEALTSRKLDEEPRLPIALGAALEVQSHVMARQGRRSEAVYFLERELDEYKDTSIRTRINKNINLLSLEGKAAPAYDTSEYIGEKPPAMADLRGKPVILFFWAHWCGDCKAMAPVLADLHKEYKDKGLTIVAPTQRYGYVAKREPADPRREIDYIAEINKEFYGAIGWTVPVNNDSFANWGASTTPTVVLVDRQGIVRLYHPGQMTRDELEPHVRAIVEARATSAR